MYIQFYFVISTKCNLHCSHCIRKYSDNYNNLQLSKDDIINITSQSKTRDLNIIPILTGGEPTIADSYFDILDYLTQKFPKVYTCTNGVLEEEKLNKLYKYKNNYIQISLDGNSTIHNKIRGEGSFEKASLSIEKLEEKGINVSVSSTVNKYNLQSMFELADYLSQLKIRNWKVSLEQQFENYNELMPIEEWNNFVDDLIHYAKIPLNIKKLFDFDLFERMERKNGREKLEKIANPNCGFCNSKCYIYPDLSVRGCTCIKDICFGNFKKNTLDEILDNMKSYKKELDVDISSPCYSCKWKYLCNGGCPGFSYHYNGRLGVGDIRCPLVRGMKIV